MASPSLAPFILIKQLATGHPNLQLSSFLCLSFHLQPNANNEKREEEKRNIKNPLKSSRRAGE